MTSLREVLERDVDDGTVPGAVALVAHRDDVELEAVGFNDIERTVPMARDAIFRIASITKPITAAALMMLIDDGRLALDDPIARWLPELASPMVVRTPSSPVEDVVPANRPITVFDLLTFRAGYGFPADFSLPAVQPLLADVAKYVTAPELAPPPDEWIAGLARIPMLYQPGEAWLYNTCSDIQGLLIARVSGQPFPEFLAERIFEPLGMKDTGFMVPADKVYRLTYQYAPGPDGGLVLIDSPNGHWTRMPAFPSGAGGLASTVDNWYAFARMLLDAGRVDSRQILSPESVRQMTTNHLTPAQREPVHIFLEGQGWGFGGSVDVEAIDPWNVPGRYGWVGGTGTTAHLTPSSGEVVILMAQRMMPGPTPTPIMRDIWRYAAGA